MATEKQHLSKRKYVAVRFNLSIIAYFSLRSNLKTLLKFGFSLKQCGEKTFFVKFKSIRPTLAAQLEVEASDV